MKEIKGKVILTFKFPEDKRFKGMSLNQKEIFFNKSFKGILKTANYKIPNLHTILK